MPASSSMCITLPAGAPIDCLGVNDERLFHMQMLRKLTSRKLRKISFVLKASNIKCHIVMYLGKSNKSSELLSIMRHFVYMMATCLLYIIFSNDIFEVTK